MMGLWLLVPAPIRRGLAWAVAGCIAVFAVWTAGKREARQEARTDALRGNLQAREARERIEDAIDQDVDLAARARRAGVVRPDSE